jgi:hypothetical protein
MVVNGTPGPDKELMKLLIACLLAASFVPSSAFADARSACRTRCVQQYKFCMKAALTNVNKKTCSVNRKACKNGCTPPRVTGSK